MNKPNHVKPEVNPAYPFCYLLPGNSQLSLLFCNSTVCRIIFLIQWSINQYIVMSHIQLWISDSGAIITNTNHQLLAEIKHFFLLSLQSRQSPSWVLASFLLSGVFLFCEKKTFLFSLRTTKLTDQQKLYMHTHTQSPELLWQTSKALSLST